MIKNSQSFIDFNFNKTNGNHFLFEITVKRFWRFLYINFCPIFFRVKDKTAEYTRAIGKHGRKETSTENYADSLRKKFASLVDTPKWADLDHQKEDGDSDDEFFRVNYLEKIIIRINDNS
jgi:hypothetical protein